ncbi:MAG: hypothetical protein H6822_12540 [Planctomycetaceae bacterium]|nr:hypothetical protein [Planctomycetaceae bacterium]MCB9923004.1 hypothetical protein [Planctomycetaceae bacterium]
MSRVPRTPTSQAQLDLFTPRPNVPRWSHLPRATRQTIKRHLATLIRQHAARLRNGKEADHER